MCSRAVLPKCTPEDTNWTGLLHLCPDDLRLLSTRDFGSRLKFDTDLDAVCRSKVRRSYSDKKTGPPSLEELVAAEKEGFLVKARTYVVSLLETMLRDIHFTADIIHGMGCFDPHLLLSLPLDQVTFCFNALFNSFRIRRWVAESAMQDYRDEYFEFVDHFRKTSSGIKDAPATIPDVLALLTPMPALRSRINLFHLYRLCCLCITESHQDLPAIKFQDVDTSGDHCRLSSVILPAQSYLATCPGAIAVCTSESALVKYKELDLQFTSGQLSGDPWSHVDVFGRASLLKTLTDSFISLKGVPLVGVSTSSRASSVSTSAGKKLNWAAGKAQKLAFFGNIPQSEISKTVKELRQGSSKD